MPNNGIDVKSKNETRCSCFRISSITGILYQKFAFPHDLLAIEPDVEIAADAIDMRLGSPVCTGVLGVWMTKGNVDSGNFFIL
jgi:hypothetical protein